MKIFKKFLFLLLWTLPLFGGGFVFAEGDTSKDFLQQVYHPAISAQQVVWGDRIWTTKKSVWNYVLNWGYEVECKGWFNCSGSTKTSLLVVVTKFLVRFTLIIAISMIIYNGIIFVIKSTKWEPSKETLHNLLYICLWVLLAMASVVIIRLTSSVGTTLFDMDSWASAFQEVEQQK